jgi:hypothetical protein
MAKRVHIIKHEAVPQCGSFEVRNPDGRPSQYFYWDDIGAGAGKEAREIHAGSLLDLVKALELFDVP